MTRETTSLDSRGDVANTSEVVTSLFKPMNDRAEREHDEYVHDYITIDNLYTRGILLAIIPALEA